MQISAKNIGFGILLLLGLILAFAPIDAVQKEKIPTNVLLAQLQKNSVYVQADELAHWIIDKDPRYQIADIRSEKDFNSYHIPGSIHIPFEQLGDVEKSDVFDKTKMLILASNGNTRAGQAWLLLRQMGYEDVYILAGGLNHWVQIFSNPEHPKGAYSDDELFTYQFRKAAGAAVLGHSLTIAQDRKADDSKPKPIRRKRKKAIKKVDEGC